MIIMKKVNINTIAYICLLLLLSSCYDYKEIVKTDKVESITVKLTTNFVDISPESLTGLSVSFENFEEGVKTTMPLSAILMNVDDLIPGIYTINISGQVKDKSGKTFYVNGNRINYAVIPGNEELSIDVAGGVLSPIVFKEIYYTGSPTRYFRDQFYELYNNSNEVVYLDGIYFAHLCPTKATTKLPVWPEEDKGKYVYGERVWKFPGNGRDYPLQPGESCIISQFAANHKLPQYNPNCPIDGSSSEFEFNLNNPNFPDMPAYDMLHVFYDGKAAPGRTPQYLTSVFGAAYVIFKEPDGESYDPVGNKNLQTTDLSSTSPTLYAKIPIKYVLDAVECGDNENMVTAKRVPGVLDAGMTYVGSTYSALSVVRKKASTRPDGTPILQDTNNSTDDFDRGLTPELRRYGSKMPTWNHTLKP